MPRWQRSTVVSATPSPGRGCRDPQSQSTAPQPVMHLMKVPDTAGVRPYLRRDHCSSFRPLSTQEPEVVRPREGARRRAPRWAAIGMHPDGRTQPRCHPPCMRSVKLHDGSPAGSQKRLPSAGIGTRATALPAYGRFLTRHRTAHESRRRGRRSSHRGTASPHDPSAEAGGRAGAKWMEKGLVFASEQASSRLGEHGVPAEEISKLVGHRSTNETAVVCRKQLLLLFRGFPFFVVFAGFRPP